MVHILGKIIKNSTEKFILKFKYFLKSDSRVERLSNTASNPEDAEKLWKISAKLVKLE